MKPPSALLLNIAALAHKSVGFRELEMLTPEDCLRLFWRLRSLHTILVYSLMTEETALPGYYRDFHTRCDYGLVPRWSEHCGLSNTRPI